MQIMAEFKGGPIKGARTPGIPPAKSSPDAVALLATELVLAIGIYAFKRKPRRMGRNRTKSIFFRNGGRAADRRFVVPRPGVVTYDAIMRRVSGVVD